MGLPVIADVNYLNRMTVNFDTVRLKLLYLHRCLGS
jgi:hypothetical protein